MKIILTIILSSLFVISTFAQDNAVEVSFEKNKRNLSVTKFSFGEDASSGWDYLVYKSKSNIRKIRVIWSSSSQSPRVEDYYFENGKPVLYVKFAATKKQYKALTKGTNLPLKLEEKLYFINAKLSNWNEKGKTVVSTDSRWNEKEKDVLEAFKNEVETYQSYLRGEL